ncbi:EF-hand domain-containing protein [Sulfitobacter sp. F26204]|uniref:EF-hand domain-containing protein n=1 Tax=Sulfitobacter sp. F26204 TaxID=2996014 RepID=UPI00225DEF21|nr:EF-hand domain-containing protein [Sulfitobacter sp. F26204]MCX7560841.1 EF-hand domain-containing protein [Sulfitobacter sp. F26204]
MINASHMKMVLLAGLIAAGGMATSGAASAKSNDTSERRAEMFKEIDADGSGAITQEELKAHAAARFATVDTNKDGFLTPDEMRGHRGGKRAEKMLKRHDTNGDGKLDAAELEKAAEGRHGRRAAKMMQRADTNGDGKLSLEEMSGRHDPAKMFERLDADKDGSLSAEEFAKASKGHGHKRHAD